MVAIPGNSLSVWISWPLLGFGAAPLIALASAIWLRSEALLLVGFPSALMIPITLIPELVSFEVYGPLRFTIVFVSLWAYFLGAPLLVCPRSSSRPFAIRPLIKSRSSTQRWAPHTRIYLIFPLLALALPLVLLYFVNFHTTNRLLLSQTFADRPAPVLTLLNILGLGLWFALFYWVFQTTLNDHRHGDRSLRIALTKLRTQKPNFAKLAICGGTVFSLVLLILFFWYTR